MNDVLNVVGLIAISIVVYGGGLYLVIRFIKWSWRH